MSIRLYLLVPLQCSHANSLLRVYRCFNYFNACGDKTHDILHGDKPHIGYLIPIVLLICLTCKDHLSVSVIRATRTYVSVSLIIGKSHYTVNNYNGLRYADYPDFVCVISNYSGMTINRFDQMEQHTSFSRLMGGLYTHSMMIAPHNPRSDPDCYEVPISHNITQLSSWCTHAPRLPIFTRVHLNMIVLMSDLESDVCKESPSREINTPHEIQE